MGGDKNCHGIELAHWQTSCIAGLTMMTHIFDQTKIKNHCLRLELHVDPESHSTAWGLSI